MLTPKQIKAYDFQLAGRNAYKAADVDAFVDEVYESYDQMFHENGELVKKLNLLADKLQSYKADEDNIRNALLTAERMKESIVADAEASVKSVVEESRVKADEIIKDAESQADEILRVAQANATKLLAKAQELYDDQVNSIKEEAEKEEAHLLHVKEESAKVRADLIDSYQKQISMLEFTPDFAEEIKAAHEKKKEETKENIIELETDDEEVEVEVELADEDAKVEEYLDEEETEEEPEEFEDIDSGEDLFADDDEAEDEEDAEEEEDEEEEAEDEDDEEETEDDEDLSLF